MTGFGAATATDARSAAGGGVAGLVPSKTSLPVLVSLGENDTARRRVARLKRSVWSSGWLHGLADQGCRPPVCWFVTLTYRGVSDWRADHISAAVQRFRNWCARRGIACRYTWVAELQRRGAVHYHLLAWLPVGVSMPHWDRAEVRRAAFWPHGMSNTQRAAAGVGYLMKYLSKLGELVRFPKGLRLYGIGGLTSEGRAVRSWYGLPSWAKRCFGVGDIARRAGGLVVRSTGEILAPVFAVRRLPGFLELRQLREVAARFAPQQVAAGSLPGAFSSWPRLA